MNKMNAKIIQSSPMHTASTVLINLIHGLLEPESAVEIGRIGGWSKEKLIIKTHETNIDAIMQELKEYDLYFIMSERNDGRELRLINEKFKTYKNLLIFDYSELLETKDKSLKEICENAQTKLINFLPQSVLQEAKGDYEQMYKRIQDMNNLYKKIKNKPFTYYDPFYHLHGSHRNRGKNRGKKK